MNSSLPSNECVNISQLHHKSKYYFELHICLIFPSLLALHQHVHLDLRSFNTLKLHHTSHPSRRHYSDYWYGQSSMLHAQQGNSKYMAKAQIQNSSFASQIHQYLFLVYQHNVILFNVFCYLYIVFIQRYTLKQGLLWS